MDVFRKLDWDRAGKVMARKLVIDGRNLYSPQSMRDKDSSIFLWQRVVSVFSFSFAVLLEDLFEIGER